VLTQNTLVTFCEVHLVQLIIKRCPRSCGLGRCVSHDLRNRLRRPVTPKTSLSCADQICPRRITVFRSQATKGSGALRPRIPLW